MDKLTIRTETTVLKLNIQSIVVSPVNSVNGKNGTILLTAEDVGADPLGSAQAVQENVDAEIKPQIDELRADVDLIQPQLESLSDNKLDKVDYVQHFLDVFSSKAALDAAHPTAQAGDSADIDSGSGFDVMRAIWDDSDQQWVIREVNNAQNTDQVSEGNTNLYFKAERVLATLLGGFSPVNAAINAADSIIQGLSKAQGQISNIISTFAANVRSTLLTGLVTTDNSNVTSADSVLSAIGKLEAKSQTSGTAITWVDIASLVNTQFWAGINLSQTKIEFAKIDGNIWVRGYFTTTGTMGTNVDIFSIRDTNWIMSNLSNPVSNGARGYFQFLLSTSSTLGTAYIARFDGFPYLGMTATNRASMVVGTYSIYPQSIGAA